MDAELVRVLLVDDDEDDYVLMRDRITEASANGSARTRFDVEWAATYEAALEVMRQARHHVYLVDYRLGERDGLELLRAAIAGGCTAPIIMLTGQGDHAVDVAAMQAGAADYLDKGRLSAPLLERSIRYAIERKRAEEALRQRNRELALLNRTSRALTSTLDLDQVLDIVLGGVEHLLGVAACSIWLIEPETGELVCRQAVGPQPEVVSGWRLAPGEGIAGWVVRSGESLIVPDTRDDKRHFEDIARQIGLELRSILSVPLHVKQKVIGVLQVVDTEVGRFHSSDLTLIESLAAAAAIAIDNARLHQRVLDHAERLEELVRERTAEVQAQYTRLEAVLRSVSDGIIVADGTGEITQANPVAQAWLTRTLSPEDAARLRETVRDMAIRVHERPETVLELTGLDLELEAAPLSALEIEKAIAVVAVHDVSHLKALDRMKTRFVTNVSHELRTPITTIKLYAALMQEEPEKWEMYLAPLVQEANHQARLVQSILEVSRLDAGRAELELRPTSLNELTEMTIANYRVLAQERGLTLEHRPFSSPPQAGGTGGWGGATIALVDPERVLQALNNLVGNAIRYTPEGGEIIVSTGKGEMEGRTWAMVTVADTGMGIPEEELPHVFERFFRGEEPRSMQISGTGLGLAISKEIIELHGGRITVESQVGVGSTFIAWLPLAD